MENSDEKNILNYSFDDLEIKDNLLRGIYAYGFEKPSIIQKKAIRPVLAGRDVIAQAQSGTGKTGAFTIGMLNNLDETIKKTQYIIVTPTHELAKQIYDVISELTNYMEVSIVKVIGKTNINDSRNELMKDPQVIVATPGRLLAMLNRKYVFTDSIKLPFI